MKKVCLMALSLIATLQLSAQEKPRTQEAGIVFSNLNNFGLTYRIGSEQALWRFNALMVNGRNFNLYGDSTDYFNSQFATSLSVGREYRRPITEKLSFRYGVDLSASFRTQRQERDDKTVNNNDLTNSQSIISPGINAVLGFNYSISEELLLGVEMLPYVAYDILIAESSGNTAQNTSRGEFSYGLSNTSVQLSLVYQF
jgi:hypothetical protein